MDIATGDHNYENTADTENSGYYSRILYSLIYFRDNCPDVAFWFELCYKSQADCPKGTFETPKV